MFKAVPDGGDIVIKSDGVPVARLVSDISTVSTVVLNKKSLTINPDGFSGSALSVSLFNLRGEIVARYSRNRTTPFSVPLNALANSAFLVKVTDGKTTVVSRCLSQM
jgi:antitoxin (DNA-binding transcriptional repressor) of toxin-antitoxin stability system